MELRRIFFNLDLEQLRSLLVAVLGTLEGFDASVVDEHCAEVANLQGDDDAMMETDVLYEGDPSPVIVNTFRKGPEEFEVIFIVGDELVERIKVQANDVCGVAPQQVL